MTDLEGREKKRGAPPKLQPINIGQPKDKEAHLADYFGEGSLPFNTPSLNLRPPKRTLFSKVNNNTSHSAAPGTTLATNNNTRDTSSSNSNPTGVNTDSKDSSTQSSSTITTTTTTTTIISTTSRLGHHNVATDRESVTEVPKSSQPLGNASVIDTTSESSNLHRTRTTSRLTRQEPLQKIDFIPTAEPDKPASTESVGATSEPKVAFAPAQSRISRNTEGKENLTPLTSLTSRPNVRKSLSTKSSTPRKSFNWGRPSRDAAEPAEREESKGSTSTNNDDDFIAPKVEQSVGTTSPVAAAMLPCTPDDSGSTSVELAIRDLQVDDPVAEQGSSAGPARGRQGIKRDMDEASSAPKRRKEFHPQDDLSHLTIKRASFGTSATPPSPRLTTTTPSHMPDQQSIKVEPTPVPRIKAEPAQEREWIARQPKSPQALKAAFYFPPPSGPSTHPSPPQPVQQQPQQPQQSQQSQPSQQPQQTSRPQRQVSPPPPPQQRLQHGEGIASIAQSLAVGAPKTTLLQGRSGSGVMSPPLAPASLPIGSNTSRPELGSRPVVMVNHRPYTRLAQVGKGGSSKVYKVLSTNSKIMALKKVSFENSDRSTIEGFLNEVRLLTRLGNNSRIIRLFDAEVNHAKGYLSLVMEYGEIDLAHMLHAQQSQPFDIHFIGLYWRQMLEAVQVIHDLKIVHSDLKPANFLLVEGSLKLIDFGIANAIANDTTNVHREGQLGTANYMSPEAIAANPTAGGVRKLGKPSDVWSLGCILYQMVYGRAPFADITNVFNKLNVITNPNNKIRFHTTTRSPLNPKEPTPSSNGNPGPTGGDENGGSEANSLATADANGTVVNGTPSLTTASTPMPATPEISTTVPLDRGLIRIMKGCLAYHATDRMTIPELLADPFLQPFGSFMESSSSPSNSGLESSGTEAEAGELAGETVTMDVDTLYQVLETSMVFAANRAVSQGASAASSARGAGVVDKAIVKAATEQVLRQLHAKKSAGCRPGGFVISD
ncbi:MAG: hypothetical protein J3R72DRAFT_457538 [Linnemannia gamsii]|nr:MAG: hypothetical protein J3R72DRAFT_457538 [Linnemannia gamsii]